MMKILLFILLLLSISPAWSTDTTKMNCGFCCPYITFNYNVKATSWAVGDCNCNPIPYNCHLECIDGDLYRICENEDIRVDTSGWLPPLGHPFKYDTIPACDTTWSFFFKALGNNSYYYEKQDTVIICHDTVIVRGK